MLAGWQTMWTIIHTMVKSTLYGSLCLGPFSHVPPHTRNWLGKLSFRKTRNIFQTDAPRKHGLTFPLNQLQKDNVNEMSSCCFLKKRFEDDPKWNVKPLGICTWKASSILWGKPRISHNQTFLSSTFLNHKNSAL